MSRQLLLLRHGKSDWGVDADDFNRPLKKRGKRGAQKLGVWLQQQNLLPDYIISSPAKRAFNTAKKIVKAMDLSKPQIHLDKRIYAATIADLKQVLADCPHKAQRILLIGHNPGLEEILLYLQGSPINIPDDGKVLATATLAVLNMPDNWRGLNKGSGKMVAIIRASALNHTHR